MKPIVQKMAAGCIVIAAALTSIAFTPSGSGYQVGDAVTDFNLKNVDGKNVTLAGLKNNKGAIVIFTCNHCPFSVAYEDRIIALNKKYESMGFPVVAINPNDAEKVPDDSYSNMKQRAKGKELYFSIPA